MGHRVARYFIIIGSLSLSCVSPGWLSHRLVVPIACYITDIQISPTYPYPLSMVRLCNTGLSDTPCIFFSFPFFWGGESNIELGERDFGPVGDKRKRWKGGIAYAAHRI
jgi:hypothetical protein